MAVRWVELMVAMTVLTVAARLVVMTVVRMVATKVAMTVA